MHIHIVQKGDTLWKISRSYGVSFDELKKLNAHLANPEYIVPGMKIFIPETKKMESSRHPYSEDRPVKKEMVKKEEVKIQPHHETTKKHQPVHTTHPHHPQHKHQQHHPVHISHPVHVHPIYKALPAHPIHKAQPVAPAPPVQPYTMPYHIMPVPELEMTPSPQGWRLIESTSIHINIHNEDHEKEVIKVTNEVSPVAQVPQMPPMPPLPVAPPVPPMQPTPEYVSPAMEEQSSEFGPLVPFEPMCQCEPTCQCDYCQSMPPFPYMEPNMMPLMEPHGAYPYTHVCYVPVYPCPPHPYHHF